MEIKAAAQPAASAAKADSPELRAEESKLRKAAQEFEAIFVGMLLKEMQGSSPAGAALFGQSAQARMYQQMMDEQLALKLSQSGGFGLAKVLYSSLLPALRERTRG